MVPRRPSLLPVATLAGLAVCGVLAADSPADPVLKLRSEWKSKVDAATLEVRNDYAKALHEMEKKLVAKGDYAGAAKARDEHRKVLASSRTGETTAPTVPAPVAAGEPVVLDAARATVAGGVTYDANGGFLTGWGAAGAVVSWLLPPGLKGGGYEVELTYASTADPACVCLFREERYTLKRALTATAGWDDYQTEVIGTLRLLANSRLLELSTAAVKGADLLHLKSIRLLPASDGKE